MSLALPAVLALALPALTIVAAIKDATSFTIPNWISLTLVAAFPVAALAAGFTPAALGLHVAVGAGALVFGMGLFAFGLLGGGNAKLLAAGALWVGWPTLLPFLAATLIAGGALSLGLLALRRPALRPLLLSGPAWVIRLAEPKEAAPYGVAIAVGALYAFPLTPFVAG